MMGFIVIYLADKVTYIVFTVYILSVFAFSRNRTHELGVANTVWDTGRMFMRVNHMFMIVCRWNIKRNTRRPEGSHRWSLWTRRRIKCQRKRRGSRARWRDARLSVWCEWAAAVLLTVSMCSQKEYRKEYESEIKGKVLLEADLTPAYLTARNASSLLSEVTISDASVECVCDEEMNSCDFKAKFDPIRLHCFP